LTPNEKLASWFRQNSRRLSFRETRNPYKIWVSEIMLQQTRVQAMLPLFDTFVQKFPDIEALAKADEEEVLGAWQGLGYYSRAKNLRKAAIQLVRDRNGSFPRDLDEALALPGVGPYTARAILSIAFGISVAVLDGNVKRILSRFFAFEKPIGPQSNSDLQELADSFLANADPGLHNEAMMELGATLCLPKNPKCLLCPLKDTCLAFLQGKTNSLPLLPKKNPPIEGSLHLFLVRDEGDKILLVRSQERRFFKGIPSLPFAWVTSEVSEDPLQLQKKEAKFLGKVKHSITKYKITAQFWSLKMSHSEAESLFSGNLLDWVEWSHLPRAFPSSLVKKLKDIFDGI